MTRKRIALIVFLLAFPFAVFGFRTRLRAQEQLASGVFDPPRDAPDFELDGSFGRKIHLRDYLGKVVVLEFGFTYCQTVCPVTLGHLMEAHAKLGAAAHDVQVLFVTVDPERDSPQRLHEFLGVFNPSFVGATGADDALANVQKAYGIATERLAASNPQLGYQVGHSSFLYLIDRRGKIRALVPFNRPVDEIVHDLRILVGQ